MWASTTKGENTMTTYKITETISGEVSHVSFRDITCTWHHDPAHEWLEVSRKVLKEFDLRPQDFSEFSYADHDNLYLEGDCDAGKFIHAIGDKAELTFIERPCDAKFNVRTLRHNS